MISAVNASRLMVLIPDCLSDLIRKGEVTERYYNPCELFAEVHLVLVNDDHPDPDAVQKMVGQAKLFLHNLPAGKGLLVRSAGWRPWLLKGWARQAVKLAQQLRPALIRCHGALLNAFAAAQIKRELGIPYVVSMHTNPDQNVHKGVQSLLRFLVDRAREDTAKTGLLNADLVLPVYNSIIPYLERLGVKRYEVCYNVLNPSWLRRKDSYRLHDPVRIISVGRQFRGKDPKNLIRAVAELPNTHLTLVGDGAYHDSLKELAAACRVSNRVIFHRAIDNDELCWQLPEYDIFAVHTEYWELSKSVLESFLSGLPVVINRRLGKPVPELTEDICFLVEDSVEGYMRALNQLISDDQFREQLGRAAYAQAQIHWAPAQTEAKYGAIYRCFLQCQT